MAANRTEDGLRTAAAEQAKIDAQRAREVAAAAAAEHEATDAAEDALYGPDRRGDELPAELVDERSRAARIEQAIAELKAHSAAGGKDREAAAKRRRDREQQGRQQRQLLLDGYREQGRQVPVGRPPAEIRVEVLDENLAAHRARAQAKIDAWQERPYRGGRIPAVEADPRVQRAQACLDRAIAERAAQRQAEQVVLEQAPATGSGAARKPKAKPRRNITDPQSRIMPLRGGGWVQGYNCQAATSSDGLIIATSVGNNPNDATAFSAIMDNTAAAATLIDAHRPSTAKSPTGIGVVLADAGYLSIENLTTPGPDRLIAVGKSHDVAVAAHGEPVTGPPPPNATPVEAMAHRLRTPEGHDLYKQRSHIAETPFGHAKHNLGFRRFTSRGIDRAAAEFSFHALVHNMFKAITAGALTPATI